jgi:hypothetical protein
MTPTDERIFLEQFDRFLVQRVAPRAPEEGGLRIRMPDAEGGCFLSAPGFARFRIQLARYGGALSFLQAQHQVAVTWLSRSPQQEDVRPLYQNILQDGMALGIGFLSPRHRAFEVKQEGRTYLLSGDIPWVTGYGFLQHVVTSFQYDGQRHFLMLPFHACTQGSGHLSYSEPLQLIIFNALNTVRVQLDNWPVPQDKLFLSLPLHPQQEPERHNSVYTLAGACKGLQDLVRQCPDLPAGMQIEYDRLTQQLDGYVRKIMVAGGSPAVLRAEAARLAQDWSALARWAYGGKALLLDHPVNRLSREIWQYGVAGLRPADLEVIYP